MKDFVLLLRVNASMDPGAFTDPKEVVDRAKWLQDVQANGVVKYLGGTMPPIPQQVLFFPMVLLRKVLLWK